MNKQEAKEIITKQLQGYRQKPYSELRNMIDAGAKTSKYRGASGTLYQIEILALWDDNPNGNIRVIGSIDDGEPELLCRLVMISLRAQMTTL